MRVVLCVEHTLCRQTSTRLTQVYIYIFMHTHRRMRDFCALIVYG